MALNIKDTRTEALAAEVAALSGESKTRAIRTALEDRLERLLKETAVARRKARLDRFLRTEAWPQIPEEARGKPITREEREAILGYGPEGV